MQALTCPCLSLARFYSGVSAFARSAVPAQAGFCLFLLLLLPLLPPLLPLLILLLPLLLQLLPLVLLQLPLLLLLLSCSATLIADLVIAGSQQ